jgi:hypothetical protein
MFSRNLLGQRWRRLRRSIEEPLALNDFMDLDEILDALCRWGKSMPWVDELPCSHKSGVGRKFVVDCPVLARQGPWFAVAAVNDELEVLVVLPDILARQGVTRGWASSSMALDADRRIATVALPTTTAELCALQELLAVGYSAAFDADGSES